MNAVARLRGRWLRLAWVVVAAAYAVPFVAALPLLVQQYSALTGSALTMGYQEWKSADLRAAIAAAGVPVAAWTAARLASDLLVALGSMATGLLIFWRRPGDRFGLFVSLYLVMFGLASGNTYLALRTAFPGLDILFTVWVALPWLAFYIFFYTFPTGQFVPRWTVIVAPAILGLFLFWPRQNGAWLPVLIALVFGSALFAQMYRYARVSNATERAQAKWVTFAIAVIALVELVGQGLLPALFPAVVTDPVVRLRYGMGLILGGVFFLLVPLAVTIAILRYQLWNIDVVIRRTLVYTVLTGSLALAYFGSIVALQNIFSAFTGQSQATLVTVLSTLVIAALFVPLRGRVQSIIDRRLFRRKYDAARTLAAFGASLRDETNLDQLTGHLTSMVQSTMEPASVGLWLKPAADGRRSLDAGQAGQG